MDVSKLTLGKQVFKNLTGEEAGMRIALHNALKNMPPYLNMANYAKEIEHMTPRSGSFTELPSDFFTKDSHEYRRVLLKGNEGNGKDNFAKTGGLSKLMEEMGKHKLNLPKFEPCGLSDISTIIDRYGKPHVFTDWSKLDFGKDYIERISGFLNKESNGKIKLNGTKPFAKTGGLEEAMKERASKKVVIINTNDPENLDPEIAKRLKKE